MTNIATLEGKLRYPTEKDLREILCHCEQNGWEDTMKFDAVERTLTIPQKTYKGVSLPLTQLLENATDGYVVGVGQFNSWVGFVYRVPNEKVAVLLQDWVEEIDIEFPDEPQQSDYGSEISWHDAHLSWQANVEHAFLENYSGMSGGKPQIEDGEILE